VADAGAVWNALATSLGVRSAPGRNLRDVLLEYLAPKRLLLVLDNCEHLLPALCRAADAIVQSCPGITVLATSRERLAVPGEQNVVVSPLPVPPPDATVGALARSDSVRLFCERAHDADDAFRLTDRNAPAVAELCRRLDGLPLALELAAARVRSVSPDVLVARIDECFRLLTKGSRSTSERHQTLRTTIDWSYNLLTHAEQRALNGMSVFAGGCDLASAEAVLGADDVAPQDVVNLLDELVDKSLVEVVTTDGSGRYRLLETIRRYARERLEAAGEATRVRGRHLARYIGLAEDAGPHLRGRDLFERAALLARDAENFRAALDWAVEADLADEALRLVMALTVGPTSTGWVQTDWVETAISIPGASRHVLYPRAVAIAATGAAMRLDLDRAATLVAIAQDAQARLDTHYPEVHLACGTLAMFHGHADQARHDAEIAVDLARASQDPSALAGALTLYATTLHADRDKAAVVAEEAVRVSRDAEIPSAFIYAVFSLTSVIAQEQPARTDALFDEVADVARKLGDTFALALTVGWKMRNALVQEDWPTALRIATDAAEQDLQLGGSVQFGAYFIGASIALAHLQIVEPAAVLAGFAERFPHLTFDQDWQRLFAANEKFLLGTFGPTRAAELKAHGATLSNAEAFVFLRSQYDRAVANGSKRLGGTRAHPTH
jgi:predicted ATPase